MKSPISENGAAITVLDQIFKQMDYEWPGVWDKLNEMVQDTSGQQLNAEFAKFSLILGATALNLRATFDLFPKAQAERIFIQTMKLYEAQFKNPKQFYVITAVIRKIMDVYNVAITSMSDPFEQVAFQVYHNLGIKIQGAKAGTADHGIVAYLSHLLMEFSGKWDKLRENFEVLEEVV